MNTEEFLDQEISLLNARISNADSILFEFADLVDATNLVKSKLDLSKEFMNRNNPVLAYKAMLDGIQQLIFINQSLIERMTNLKKTVILTDDAQPKD